MRKFYFFSGKNPKIRKWKKKEGKVISQGIAASEDGTRQEKLNQAQITDLDMENIKRNKVFEKNIKLAKQQLKIKI